MSTLEEDKQKYHHGDLRNTLIQIGTQMLIESGESTLSLRKIAQRAGVSHNAPYQHFADKDALLAAIAEDGFRILGEAMDTAISQSQDESPQAQLHAVGLAYVNFAVSYPSHLQLMFGTLDMMNYPSLVAQSHETFMKLVQTVLRLDNLKHDNPQDVAIVMWLLIHGLSTMVIGNKIPSYVKQDRSTEALLAQFIRIIGEGILKP